MLAIPLLHQKPFLLNSVALLKEDKLVIVCSYYYFGNN